ncbi:alpha-L-fucosidase, partial [bacterium]|nr:alpha-L-fucosidase [bacterium]
GYYRDEYTWKSVRQLVVLLIESVSKGGNLLLNVGPTARGTFDDRAINALNGIGEWMKLHSRSIYNCTQAPEEFEAPEKCLLTYNPELKRLYLHVLEWPVGGRAFASFYLDGFAGKVKYAQLLHDASEIRFTDKNTLRLSLPVKKPDVTVPVIEIFLK